MNKKAYFPGGNTTKGFFSYYDSITNPCEADYIYTIKGGPGVGKSTFMKKIAKEFEELGFKIRYYHCSSDPNSVDGIFIENIKVLFTDGTSPHIIDPKFPGCVDKIINLGDFLDDKKLKKNKLEIIETTKKISGLFTSAYDCLEGISPLYHNINRIHEKALIRDKFNSSLKALIKEITDGRKGSGYKNKKLFLSAITPENRINFINETIDTPIVYILNSEPGDLSHLYMKKISEELESKDFSFESYYCPLSPEDKIEHIIIPELGTAIVTSNRYHKFIKDGIETDTSKFYKTDLIDKSTIDFNLKLSEILTERAIFFIKNAKSTHDVLEDFYKNAMDYSKLNNFTESFIKQLKEEFVNKL